MIAWVITGYPVHRRATFLGYLRERERERIVGNTHPKLSSIRNRLLFLICILLELCGSYRLPVTIQNPLSIDYLETLVLVYLPTSMYWISSSR